jgi:hypothetical protein
MKAHELGVCLLDRPRDVDVGTMLEEVGDRGKVVDHVAERGELDEQDTRRGHAAF